MPPTITYSSPHFSVHLLILPQSPACLDWWWQVLPSWRTGTTRWVPCTEGREPAHDSELIQQLLLWDFNYIIHKITYIYIQLISNTNKSPYISISPSDCRVHLQGVISSTGSELMATVDVNGSVTCQLPVSGIAITDAERVGMVELHWRNGTNTFVIERSNMKKLSEC